MTTLITHMAIPLLSRIVLGKEKINNRLLCAGVAVTLIPDLDVVLFKFGVDYADQFGHRGATHSLLFVFVVTLIAAGSARFLKCSRVKAFLFVGLCALSHPVFDAFTNGGLGVGWFWPWDQTRYFFPYTPIEVSPFHPKHFLTARGINVLLSELLWVWLPLGLSSYFILFFRNHFPKKLVN